MARRAKQIVCGVALLAAAFLSGCWGARPATELQRVKSGALDILLLSPHDALRHGTDTFNFEFRSSGKLVDVGTVRATASMPMPGMAMFGSIDVTRTDVSGRYAATGRLEMAGTWRMTVEWDGPAGKGSVSFSETAQ